MSQVNKQSSTREADERDEGSSLPPAATPEDLVGAVGDLLDEIDAVLEENAEAFVRAYIQKPGE